MSTEFLQQLADTLSLKGVLDGLKPYGWEHVDHWMQGEFHHDVVVRIRDRPSQVPGSVFVVSTNCNGGVKEVACMADVPDRWGLWHQRCPDNPEFAGPAPQVLATARTRHWFDPCDLLKPGTRSEYLPEFRRKQKGGGFVYLDTEKD